MALLLPCGDVETKISENQTIGKKKKGWRSNSIGEGKGKIYDPCIGEGKKDKPPFEKSIL